MSPGGSKFLEGAKWLWKLSSLFSLGIRQGASAHGCQLSPNHGLRLTPHPSRSLAVNSLKYKLSPGPDHTPGPNPGHRLSSGSGSGSGSDFLIGMEHEYQPIDTNDAFYDDFKPVSSDNPDLGQNGLEENFIM